MLNAAAYSLPRTPRVYMTSRIDHIQGLFLVAAMRGVSLIRQVESLEIDAEVLVEVVAGAEVHIRGGIHEGGLDAELRVVLRLTVVLQMLILMVDRDAYLETVLVVKRYEVIGIRETRHREVGYREIVGVIRLVRADERGVGLEAKAGIAKRVLPRQLDASDLGRWAIDLRSDAENRR